MEDLEPTICDIARRAHVARALCERLVADYIARGEELPMDIEVLSDANADVAIQARDLRAAYYAALEEPAA